MRGDEQEIFFSYGYNKRKSKVLFSYSKQQIPDAFISTAFKKHFNEIMNEKRNEDSSSLFYFLPSISDRKETINQWKNNPSLVPIDFSIDFIESFSSQNEKFRPDLLNSTDNKVREPQVEMLYGVFKHMAQVSNQNLERNIAYLNLKQNRNSMKWSGVITDLIHQNLNLLINLDDDVKESPILDLPIEIWEMILDFVSIRDIISFKFLSKYFY